MTRLTRRVVALALASIPVTAFAQAPKVVISQVYGGAGCGTANCSSYKNDFIEIFNSGSAAQNLNGWSVQYTAATGTAWVTTNLTNVTLQPGQYYLIAEGAGSNGINNIPTPDVSGAIAMSAVGGKVALLNTTTSLNGSCPSSSSIIDFVGYGSTASCNEGGANAPAPSTFTSVFRAGSGCTDANNNGTDFSTAAPNPRNSSVTTTPCPSALPVSFITFRAQYQEAINSVILSWSTAQERGAGGFTVQRSADGTTWTDVLHVDAAGHTAAVTQYEATDTQPPAGLSLYRIRQQDLDGRPQYTGIISVSASGKPSELQVFPNPTTGVLRLSALMPVSATAVIRITDLSGRIVLQEQRPARAGQALEVDLSHLDKGTYFLTLSAGAFLKTEKICLY